MAEEREREEHGELEKRRRGREAVCVSLPSCNTAVWKMKAYLCLVFWLQYCLPAQ
jgi:hypothetical protein